jgi:hypothetical protein
MKINEILLESSQLDEGPILNKVGTAIGKGVGTAAKVAGAVAGGVAGVGQALKKGYQAGKGTVGAAGDGTTAPAGTAPTAAASTAPTAQQINKQGPAGTAPAKQQTGVAAQAMQKTAKAMAGQTATKAGDTLYAQVKSQVGQLDKKGKQRILQLLQKSLTAPAPKSGAVGQMATQLTKGGTAAPNTMANAPVSKTNTAKPGNPNAAAATAQAQPAAKPAAKQKPAAAPAAQPAAQPAAAPASGEKTIANPVATVGTRRATNIGEPTFDKETGKALPGQALNAIRKKAEYGSGVLGKTRKKLQVKGAGAPAAAPTQQTAGKIDNRPSISESFSLFRKK